LIAAKQFQQRICKKEKITGLPGSYLTRQPVFLLFYGTLTSFKYSKKGFFSTYTELIFIAKVLCIKKEDSL
jgi:hypothetical protein